MIHRRRFSLCVLGPKATTRAWPQSKATAAAIPREATRGFSSSLLLCLSTLVGTPQHVSPLVGPKARAHIHACRQAAPSTSACAWDRASLAAPRGPSSRVPFLRAVCVFCTAAPNPARPPPPPTSRRGSRHQPSHGAWRQLTQQRSFACLCLSFPLAWHRVLCTWRRNSCLRRTAGTHAAPSINDATNLSTLLDRGHSHNIRVAALVKCFSYC